MTFDAWYLPHADRRELQTEPRQFGAAELRVPLLTAHKLEAELQQLRAAGAALRALPVLHIAEAIDNAARRITSTETKEGRLAHALLPRLTGYSAETIRDVLAHMAADWSLPSLHALIEAELGGQPETENGPRLAWHIFSGNVPGVAVTSMIRSLLVKAPTFGKSASGEPVLPALFARCLASIEPVLGNALAVTYWPGGARELEDVALREADTVVVYGGGSVVEEISARAGHGTRVVVHGPKLSFGVVGPGAGREDAGAVARSVAAYDQQGCVSPHVVFVQQGGKIQPQEFARAVAAELGPLAVALPRRRLAPGEAAAIREARTRAEFGGNSEFYGPADLSYTVIYDEQPELTPSCLNRTLYVRPFTSLEQLAGILRAHAAFLQSAGLAGYDDLERTNVERLLTDCGVTRIDTFERLPWPPMTWLHDGRGPLRELLIVP